MHSKYAFSLVELMVAVGIVGILVTLALPRYHAFIVQARRGEAKSNLHHIATLQETYRAEHGGYYSGAAMAGTNGIGYKDGLNHVGDCNDYDDDRGLGNRLGFRPKACDELRYFYQLKSGGHTVIASAASDANQKHIFPDCSGPSDCFECGYDKGDALTLVMSDANPEVCRNITKYCPDGASCDGVITPPPDICPPCTTDTTWGSVDTSQTCTGEYVTQTGIESEICTGAPACVSATYTTVTLNIPGTKDCSGCTCPNWPSSATWPAINTSTTCKGTNISQTITQTRTCTGTPIPPATSCPDSRTLPRLVAGTKDCTCDDLSKPQPIYGCTSVEQWSDFPTCDCQCINSEPVGGCPAHKPWNRGFCACRCPVQSCPIAAPTWDANNCVCKCSNDVVSCFADGGKDFDPDTCSCQEPGTNPFNPNPCSSGDSFNKQYWVWTGAQSDDPQMRCCEGDLVATSNTGSYINNAYGSPSAPPPCGCKPLEVQNNNTCQSDLVGAGKGRNCMMAVFNNWINALGNFITENGLDLSGLQVYSHNWGTISPSTADPAKNVSSALYVYKYLAAHGAVNGACPPYVSLDGGTWQVSPGPVCNRNYVTPTCPGTNMTGMCQVNIEALKGYMRDRLFNDTSHGGAPECQ